MHGDEPVLREVWRVVRRYPLACFGPAAFLGTIIQLSYLVEADRAIAGAIVFVTGMFAFTFYLSYIEQVATEAEAGVERIGVRHALRLMRQAMPLLLAVTVATAITLVSISAGLVIALVGIWLLTRWSLAVPIIARQRVGPRAALRESARLVRGRFWPVFFTAALAIIVEQSVTSLLPVLFSPIYGQTTWGSWLLAAAVTSLVMPFCGLTVSVAYERRAAGDTPRLL